VRTLNLCLIVFASWALSLGNASASLILTSIDTTEVIDFETFQGTGFSPGAVNLGNLDSNSWAVDGVSDGSLDFGGTRLAGDFARGTDGTTVSNGVGSGGIYAFDTDPTANSNIGLGIQPIASDFSPGTLTLRVLNSTGFALDGFDIAYQVYILNNEDRSSSFNFSFSTDDTAYQAVSPLDLTSPAAEETSPVWEPNLRSQSISFASQIADGDVFFLRWTIDDVGGSGSRDEFTLDDISVTGRSLSAIPEPASAIALLMLGSVGLGFDRWRRKETPGNARH